MAIDKGANKEFLSLLKSIRTLKSQLGVIAQLKLDDEQKAIISKAVKELCTTINEHY